MSRNRGRRHDDFRTRKLNVKKVIATIIAIIVFVMIIISLKNLLTVDKKNNEVSSLTTYIPVLENNKWGVIDNKGNTVISLNYDEMVVIPDENKDLFICTYDINYDNETYKTKVLNKDNNEIFTEYENVKPVENNDGSNVWYEKNCLIFSKDGKYGLINFEGKVLLEPIYDKIYALPGIENSIIIEKDNKKGLVNSSAGQVIIEPIYTEIVSLSETYENGYIVKDDQNKNGLISPDKTKILDNKYDEIKRVAGSNYYVVVENGVLEIINKTGNVILNSGFDSVEEIQADNFIIIKDGKYGVIDNKGNTVIANEYNNLKFATQNTLIAQKDGKYGIIKKDKSQGIDFKYDRISYINTADFFQAENSDFTTDIIDSKLQTVLSSVYVSEINIEDGYLRIRQNDDYKYYNFAFEEKTNKEILSTNTLFLVKKNGKYGYENKNGEQIVDCIYDDAKEQNKYGFCSVKKDGLWGALKSDGTVVVKPSSNLDNYLYIDFIADWHRYNDLTLNIYTK